MGYHTPAEQAAIRQTVVLQADHTNCIPRSELPGLPDGITPGFTAKNLREMGWMAGDWQWLAALLNTCYPAPTATKEG